MTLAGPFLAALGGTAHGQAAVDELATPALEDRLEELWQRARTAWPAIDPEADRFVAHLARHVPPAGARAYLDSVNVEDLALAHACMGHDPQAIRELEARCFATIPQALAQFAAGPPVEEVTQRLRERLLVGAGGRGKIAGYSGRGPLTAWVRASAVRTAISLLRSRKALRESGADGLDFVPAVAGDPELELVRTRYGEVLKAALQQAIDTLPARDRNVLRFNYVDGLSIDQIGVLYRVHRATAARWLGRARELILAETRRLVIERLAVTDSELESLVRVLRSQLEVSLRSFFG